MGCGDDDAPATDAGSDSGSGGAGGARTERDAGPREERDASPASDAGRAPETLTLRFRGVVGQRDFACGQQYEQIGSSKLSATPIDFRFFVQDIKLITRSGEEVDFEIPARAPFQGEGVALIDFTDGKGECAGDPETNTEIIGRAPAGEYDGIAFSNGVPDSLNHQNIALAAPPLQNAALYWGWLNGYRFLLAEIDPIGLLDADDAGVEDAGVAATSSLIHIGSGGCAGSNKNGFTCSRPNRNRVRLTGFDPTKDAVVADFAAVFAHSDLRLAKQCHGAESGCEGVFEALGVGIESGKPLDTQAVFRTP